ncbi:hypothetical protein, partial [Sandarakinorhabdus sp.]|uniref:hypothetical protein n=1 Tax=Sandarakinorhabdus sp. TaxID=1916663 RepID=UPI00334154AF
MQFRIGTFAIIAAGLISLAAPVVAEEASAQTGGFASPISAVTAASAMFNDDSASNPASTVAEARRRFLAALASERTDAATLTRLLPRAGQPLAALIGAAPAGDARAEAVLRRLGLDPARFMAGRAAAVQFASPVAAQVSAQGGPFIAATDPRVRTLQADA